LFNSLDGLKHFVPRPSDFGDNAITESILLDWMRDTLALHADYVILFVLPSALFNFNREDDVFAALWNIENPIVCIQEMDGSENMRVLLVKSIPEVRDVFSKIASLSELGCSYFDTPLVRSDTHVDMATDWGILDLKAHSFHDKLLEVGKYMDVSELV
jgi:hypothetical protein